MYSDVSWLPGKTRQKRGAAHRAHFQTDRLMDDNIKWDRHVKGNSTG